jgi:hypothetical protein
MVKVTVQWYNEKGNVSSLVRGELKPQVLEKVVEALNSAGIEAVVDANKDVTFKIAEDLQSSEGIYAHLKLTLNTEDGSVKKERKKAAKKTKVESEPVPNLFE